MAIIERTNCADPFEDKTIKSFRNKISGEEYRRIIGGMAWPFGTRPGFALVVGEDLREDPTIGKRCYRVLEEHENPERANVTDLLRRCTELNTQYCVERWYGEPCNKPMHQFLDMFNYENRERSKGFRILDAPNVDDPRNSEFYLNLIKDLTKETRKVLHLGKESLIPTRLRDYPADKLSSTRAQEYPTIAALGYALAALDQDYVDLEELNAIQDRYFEQFDVPGL